MGESNFAYDVIDDIRVCNLFLHSALLQFDPLQKQEEIHPNTQRNFKLKYVRLSHSNRRVVECNKSDCKLKKLMKIREIRIEGKLR